MMNLLNEMKSMGCHLKTTPRPYFVNFFEDNAGAIHIAKVLKMRPRTGTSTKYHHFRESAA
jgi:hypothetical protein